MEEFSIEKKIYYHDTDCGGVVYYANYLEYLEEGLSEYCQRRGIKLQELMQAGTYFAVAHSEINYKAPARYQDTVKIITRVEKAGDSSVSFLQKILKDNTVLIEAKITWVCVGRDFKSRSLPEQAKKAFLTSCDGCPQTP